MSRRNTATPSAHCEVSDVRSGVRAEAVRSFAYFTQTVLGLAVEDELLHSVQECVDSVEDGEFSTAAPRTLAISLTSWLHARGVACSCNIPLPAHEVLHWLELAWDPRSAPHSSLRASVRCDSAARRVEVTFHG